MQMYVTADQMRTLAKGAQSAHHQTVFNCTSSILAAAAGGLFSVTYTTVAADNANMNKMVKQMRDVGFTVTQTATTVTVSW